MRALYVVLVFTIPSAGRWVPLTKPVAQKILGGQIPGMGLDESQYRFHSFRHGALQEAVLVEPSLELVRLQSVHVSDAIYAYTALPGSRRFCVSQKVGNSLMKELAGCHAI